MKVLVATAWTQGARSSDYHWCVEGELVWIGIACARDVREMSSGPDSTGGCGCGRGFAGMNSHRATTTARVAELDMSRDEYLEAFRSSLASGGWNAEAAEDLASEMLGIAADFPLNAVMERCLDVVRCRAQVSV